MDAERMDAERMDAERMDAEKASDRRQLSPPQFPPTPLGLQAAAEMERYFALRSTDIATHLGLSPAAVHRWHDANPVYWQYLERKWMAEAFGPLAPRYDLARQAREDRRQIREARAAARREAWVKNAACSKKNAAWTQAERDAQQRRAVFGEAGFGDGSVEGTVDGSSSPPRVPLWQRLTVGLMDGLRRLTGAGLVLAALYFGATWLAHHGGPEDVLEDVLPGLARAARFLVQFLVKGP